MKVQRNGREFTVEVTADGEGVVSHAGATLLAETADRMGLTEALSEGLAPMRERRGIHDPGRVVRDLAVMLASGGEALCDLRAIREQEPLFGAVASDATAWRTVAAIARDPELLDALRVARRQARESAWAAGAEPEGPFFVDLDPTLVEAASEKEGAAPTFKRTFGFHPMLAYLDRPADPCGGEPLAGALRPGNAGANTVVDQIEVAEEALEQLPAEIATDSEIVLRCDSAGATHGLLDWAREGGIRFSVGFDLTEPVREAIARIPDERWVSALSQDGSARPNGELCEATDLIDLSGWPEGSRLIVRRERPHPGAQLSYTDSDGHRFQAILTDRTGGVARLEREHRARARCEDRIRCAKQMGLDNLPFFDFEMNAVWLELVLIAQLLVALTDTLLLRGELSGLEPKRLRYRPCTRPAASPSTPAAPPCAWSAAGPGRRSSPRPSRGSAGCRCRPAEHGGGSLGPRLLPPKPIRSVGPARPCAKSGRRMPRRAPPAAPRHRWARDPHSHHCSYLPTLLAGAW